MRIRTSLLATIVVAMGLGLFTAKASLAQTETTVDVRNFEVLAVDGNRLIIQDQKGTQTLTVPDEFRFKVDGKQMSVKELKPGMKGQATVSTKTTITPVISTMVREATVVSTTGTTVTIKGADGVRRRFNQSALNKRGIEMIKDGGLVRIGDLQPGDLVTATFITQEPPSVVTEKEVDVQLAQAKAEPASEVKPSEPPAAATPAPATAPPEPAASPVAQASAPPSAPEIAPIAPAAEPPPQQGSWLLWVVALIAIAGLVVYLVRRKKP